MESILESDTIEFTKWFKKLSKKKKEFASVLMIPNVDTSTLNKIRELTDIYDFFNSPIGLVTAYESSKGIKK